MLHSRVRSGCTIPALPDIRSKNEIAQLKTCSARLRLGRSMASSWVMLAGLRVKPAEEVDRFCINSIGT